MALDVIDVLKNRRAKRSFDSRPLPPEVEDVLWRAASIAPSQGNNQPVRLLIGRAGPGRERLEKALVPGNQTWAPKAPLLVGIAAHPGHDLTVRNSDGSERDVWGFDAGLMAAHLMTQATALGLVAHPMAGFDEVGVREAFGAPPELRVLAVMAIGYPGEPEALPEGLRAKEVEPQRRLPLSHLLVTDGWRDEHAVSWKEYRDRAEGKA